MEFLPGTTDRQVLTVPFFGVLVGLALVCLLGLPVSEAANDASPFTADQAQKALEAAREYVGVQYVYQGEERKGVAYLLGGQDTVSSYLQKVAEGQKPGVDVGIDASGLVINAYRVVFPKLRFASGPPDGESTMVRDVSSQTMYSWNVQLVTVEDLRPGDLVFFGTSEESVSGVALYAGRQGVSLRIIVASQRQGRVIETGIRLNGEYWNTHVVGVGRLLKR